MKMRLWFAVLMFPFCAFASAFLTPPFPASVGINIHFITGHEHDLDMIAAAGFRNARMDFLWSATEPAKGRYDWSAYDELTANLESRGIRPYYILDYSNPLYETNSISPQHPESVRAFARWAAAAAKHFKRNHVIWEIWNEPNGGFWAPHPNVQQYTRLALATCKAIRHADRRATIVAPACYGFDWAFLKSFLDSGALRYLDAVSVHPYRSSPPETVARDFQQLRQLIAGAAPRSREIPIVSGEWGYSSKSGGISPQTQADYLVRQQLFNLYCGVPVSIWYDWSNDGPSPTEIEHNFGTVTLDLKPKPAYTAIQTFTRELSGYNIARRCHTGWAADVALTLTNAAGQVKLVAWTRHNSHNVTFTFSDPPSANVLSCITGDGNKETLKVEGQRFSVQLNAAPRIISLERSDIQLTPSVSALH